MYKYKEEFDDNCIQLIILYINIPEARDITMQDVLQQAQR